MMALGSPTTCESGWLVFLTVIAYGADCRLGSNWDNFTLVQCCL
uniref:Uncharacterized protein n=1 Tax=Anguilla anguilla TaxID=7936 RepID=A0A0E9VUW7_ANGAN